MLARITTMCVAYWFIPTTPSHLLIFALVVLVGWRLAGQQVIERFMSSFNSPQELDESARSRLELWRACLDTMGEPPIVGVGPNHWALAVAQYGFVRGKFAHTLWLQIGAELGIPGLLCLLVFYGSCVLRLWPLTRASSPVVDPWFREAGRMVVAGLVGFVVAAQFVSLYGLEVSYYIALIGAGVLKLSTCPSASAVAEPAHAPAVPQYVAAGRA